MNKKVLLCTIAALCLIAGSAFANSLLSADKSTKAGGPAEPNKGLLNCAGATEIALNNTYSGDNTGAANNVSTYACSTWNESGGEVVFHIFLAGPTMWHTSMTSSCDLDLVVLNACNEGSPNCLIVSDLGGVTTNVPVQGDFYFVVDGYAGAACPFTFTITQDPLPAAVDFCQYAVPLTCTDQLLSGDTTSGQNLLTTQMSGCTGYAEQGRENYYAITLQPGGNFAASVGFASADAAIYVLDGCAEPFNCLAGADDTFSGQAETVSYQNTGAVAQTVYLVIDAYGSTGYGPYTGTFACTGGVVATGTTSWGTVKSAYK